MHHLAAERLGVTEHLAESVTLDDGVVVTELPHGRPAAAPAEDAEAGPAEPVLDLQAVLILLAMMVLAVVLMLAITGQG